MMDNEIHNRLDKIERKLDACLVLLRMVTSHGDFTYTLTNKSERWITAIREAEKIANSSIDAAVGCHQDRTMEDYAGSPRSDHCLWGNKAPSERVRKVVPT